MRRRILVTGGAGYIGSVLVKRLLGEGCEVTVFDRLAFGNFLAPHKYLSVIQGDVRDREALLAAVEGHSSVVHLAFLTLNASAVADHEVEQDINVHALAHLLEICSRQGVENFVLASTCSIYGSQVGEDLITEKRPVDVSQLGSYARSKWQCEHYLQIACERFGLAGIALRAATVCGTSPNLRLDLSVNKMVAMAYFDGRIEVSGGAAIRPTIHIEDLAEAYGKILNDQPKAGSFEVFNAAYENRSVLETALTIANVSGKLVSVDFPDHRKAFERSYAIDSTKISRAFNFVPKRGAEIAARELEERFRVGAFPGAPRATRFRMVQQYKSRDWAL